MNFKEIKRALGKDGRIAAKKHFNDEYAKAGFPYGPEFSRVVAIAVNRALMGLGDYTNAINSSKFHAGTADSVAHWIDRN